MDTSIDLSHYDTYSYNFQGKNKKYQSEESDSRRSNINSYHSHKSFKNSSSRMMALNTNSPEPFRKDYSGSNSHSKLSSRKMRQGNSRKGLFKMAANEYY